MRYLFLFVILLFASTGCKKMTLNKTEKRLSDGTWSIYLYSENGNNLTEKGYSEYTFSFNGEGGMIGVDAKGNTAMVFNSAGMYRAFQNSKGESAIAIYK